MAKEHKHILKRAYRFDTFIEGHRKRWFLMWVCIGKLQTAADPKPCPYKVYYDLTYDDPTLSVVE